MEATKLEKIETLSIIFIMTFFMALLVFGTIDHWNKYCDSDLANIYKKFCDENKFCNCFEGAMPCDVKGSGLNDGGIN